MVSADSESQNRGQNCQNYMDVETNDNTELYSVDSSTLYNTTMSEVSDLYFKINIFIFEEVY